MLFLLFEIGSDRYCIEGSKVIEVTPMVTFKRLPHAPSYVSGLMNYRGTVTPVIDLTALLGQNPSRPLFSTRIILIRCQGEDKAPHVLGLLSEKVTETITKREEDFQIPGMRIDGAPYLGKVTFDEKGRMIQRVEMEEILPEKVKETLFAETRGAQ